MNQLEGKGEVQFSLSDGVQKIISIEAMLEVSLRNQAKILAHLTGGDFEEIKKEIFEKVNEVSNAIQDELPIN